VVTALPAHRILPNYSVMTGMNGGAEDENAAAEKPFAIREELNKNDKS